MYATAGVRKTGLIGTAFITNRARSQSGTTRGCVDTNVGSIDVREASADPTCLTLIQIAGATIKRLFADTALIRIIGTGIAYIAKAVFIHIRLIGIRRIDTIVVWIRHAVFIGIRREVTGIVAPEAGFVPVEETVTILVTLTCQIDTIIGIIPVGNRYQAEVVGGKDRWQEVPSSSSSGSPNSSTSNTSAPSFR